MTEKLRPTISITEDAILSAIQQWLADTTDPIIEWAWDGHTLEIDNGEYVEVYDRQTVLVEMVAAHLNEGTKVGSDSMPSGQ